MVALLNIAIDRFSDVCAYNNLLYIEISIIYYISIEYILFFYYVFWEQKLNEHNLYDTSYIWVKIYILNRFIFIIMNICIRGEARTLLRFCELVF